jgi:hypothetical protein
MSAPVPLYVPPSVRRRFVLKNWTCGYNWHGIYRLTFKAGDQTIFYAVRNDTGEVTLAGPDLDDVMRRLSYWYPAPVAGQVYVHGRTGEELRRISYVSEQADGWYIEFRYDAQGEQHRDLIPFPDVTTGTRS